MKHILIVLLIINIGSLYGQVTYKSSDKSFRNNYYMVVTRDSVVLYGWDLTLEKSDTVYFKASGHLDSAQLMPDGTLRKDAWTYLKKYKFSTTPATEEKLDYFKPSKDDLLPTFVLYVHIHFKEMTKEKVNVLMVKEIYDNRSDEFTFIKMK